jgi:hypothetical protein
MSRYSDLGGFASRAFSSLVDFTGTRGQTHLHGFGTPLLRICILVLGAAENAFMVAAVIYTMVNFYDVHGGSNRVPIEIFGCLVHSSRIKQVNWCGHVRRTLIDEAETP